MLSRVTTKNVGDVFLDTVYSRREIDWVCTNYYYYYARI